MPDGPRRGTRLREFAALEGRPEGIAFHPDGRSVLVHAREEIALWFAPSGERRFAVAVPAGVAGVPVFAEGGRSVVFASGGRLLRLDEDGSVPIVPDGVERVLAASPDGTKALLTADGEMCLLDLATLEREPPLLRETPAALAGREIGLLSNGGAIAATVRYVGRPPSMAKIEVRRAPGGEAFRFLNVGAPVAVALSGSGKWLLWADARATTPASFDVAKGRLVVRFLPPVPQVAVVAFGASDARRFLYAGGSRVEIWDRLRERHAASLEHPETSGRAWDVVAAAFTHDGRRVGSATADGRVFVWEL